MAGSLLSDVSDLSVQIWGLEERASIFLPNMSIRKTKDCEDGRGGHITFQQIQLFTLQDNRSVGGFHPCQSLTMLSSFAILFLFVHIKLHRGEVNCFRRVEIIAISGRKKSSRSCDSSASTNLCEKWRADKCSCNRSGFHWRSRLPLSTVGLLALLSEGEPLHHKTFYSGVNHPFTSFFQSFITPK